MRIAIDALSASAGGGRTYLLNLARTLPSLGTHEYLLFVPEAAAADLGGLPANFRLRTARWAERNYALRLLWEQGRLSRHAARWGADVLVCLGNFCPLWSPVPVVLLSRNPLYFTPRFLEDLLERRHYLWALRHLGMIRLAVWSARAARLTITPTQAMANMMRATAGSLPATLRTVHHGFTPWTDSASGSAPPPPSGPPFRFLVVSHYNYFRNFETVLRAFALLGDASGDGPFHLLLTTRLEPGLRLGGYNTTRACRLLDKLGIRDRVTTVGAVAYDDLPRLYRSVHAVICPAYTESFSHTVVEAMAMEVLVVASDIPVHREVACDAAVFFSPLNPAELAERCRTLMGDESLRQRLRAAGRLRAACFSWRRHFEELLEAAAAAASGSL